MHDPRVLFAAERTLLAWIRTGLTVMAFGFVVARFGLFLRIVRLQQSDRLMETNPQGRSVSLLDCSFSASRRVPPGKPRVPANIHVCLVGTRQ
jgi:uncharacterized membrane protein YidH (DUF202 family)